MSFIKIHEFPTDLNAAYHATGVRLYQFLQQLPTPTHYCVNIGASDGVELDILNFSYHHGYAGLAIEGDPEKYERLVLNLPEQVTKLNAVVTPANVCVLLADAVGCDMVDIDIDGYDYYVADQVLRYLSPKLLTLEINEDIPPGIKFAVKYIPDYRWVAGCPLHGCSLTMAATLTQNHPYSILALDWNTLFLVHNDYKHLYPSPPTESTLYRTGYYDRSTRQQVFYWKNPAADLMPLSLEQARQRLHERYAPWADHVFLD